MVRDHSGAARSIPDRSHQPGMGASMAITGDRYIGTYEGHTIELVRNNWVKQLALVIDGQQVANASHIWPRDIVLHGTIEHADGTCPVVAKSLVRAFFWTDDTIEVAGQPLPLTKTK